MFYLRILEQLFILIHVFKKLIFQILRKYTTLDKYNVITQTPRRCIIRPTQTYKVGLALTNKVLSLIFIQL